MSIKFESELTLIICVIMGTKNAGKKSLTSRWTWFYRIATGQDRNWEASLKAIDSFDTEEDFRDLFQYAIKKPSELPRLPINYSIFKGNILPKWEDPANENGGSLKFEIAKAEIVEQELGVEAVNRLWYTYIQHVIEEKFGKYSEKINGVELAIRSKTYKFMMWISERDDECINILKGEVEKITDSIFKPTFTFHEHKPLIKSVLKLKLEPKADDDKGDSNSSSFNENDFFQ
ncbi:eukaryotic translation initiation factor 4E-1-like [Artemia franciscana]|uniref:eukaryotic translation initiation factor 4E-1-like n=1 Tax=Artemia franciscana TaxID=6661 RepID=UPI0032DBB6D6